MKVRIKQLPKKAYGGQQADGALNVTPAKWGGNYAQAKEGKEVKQSLTRVPRSKANLEAEGGETAFGPISGDTIPDHFKIKGPRHTNGGVPLNLPEDTFIFSDTKAMRITDPSVLKMFGKTSKKGGYTPANLAKPYDINKYKAILMDPESDKKSRDTATLMIKNYVMKLGALALAQESKKGFPQGIPEMARPYMEANNITDEDLISQEQMQGQEPMMRNGGTSKFKEGAAVDTDVNAGEPTGNADMDYSTLDREYENAISAKDGGKSLTEFNRKYPNYKPKRYREEGNELPGRIGEGDMANYNKSLEDQAKAKADAEYQDYKNPGGTMMRVLPNPNDPVYQEMLKRNRKDLGLDQGSNQGKTFERNGSNRTMRVETPYGGQGTTFDPIRVRSKDDIPGGAVQSRSGLTSNENGLIYAVDPRAGFVDPNTIQGNNTSNTGGLTQDQLSFIQSLPADQQQMVMNMMTQKSSGMSSSIDPFNVYGNQGVSNNLMTNSYNNAEIFPFYNTGNAGRYNLDFSNPFSNRAFRRAGNYLTPMGAQRITGPGFNNIPISGFPQDAKLTSIDYRFKKNPLLKALLNRDIARKELEYRFNFNDALSKFTGDADVEDVDIEDVDIEMSNRDFVNENIDVNDKYDRRYKRQLLRDLNSGRITQEQFLKDSESNEEFINNSEENLVDSEELDENVDAEVEDVEVEDQDTDVPPYGGLIINTMVDAPNMQKAFGGENQTLNAFVYGGDYAHGGFHSPVENQEDPPYGGLINEFNPMTVNNDNLTTNYANAAPGQLTADLIDNQSDKDPAEKILNINNNKEEEKEGPFSIYGKQKINSAFDFNPEDFRQQAFKVANIGTQAGRLIQDAKEKDSMNRLRLKQQQNADVSQQNFYGTEYANEEGIMATGSVSNPNQMRTLGTTLGQLGGSMPIATYGASMGGSYYPTMGTGGSSRVRITSLPRKDGGGPADHPHPHQGTEESQTYIGGSSEWDDWYTSDSSKDYRTDRYDAYKQRRTDVGKGVIDEDAYHEIYRRGQKQINALQNFYKDDPLFLDSEDWDSNYSYKTDANGKLVKDTTDNRGKNWKYKAAIKQMNDKLRADNPNMDQADLDKLLYKELSGEDISNFQSGYIGGKFLDASGGMSGDELKDFIHTGVDDQTIEMRDGTVENISPEDERFGNTTNREREQVTIRPTVVEEEEEETPEVTPVKEPDPKDTSKQVCNCYPLGPDGKEDTTKTPVSSTPAPADGSPCPPCNATIRGKKKDQSINTPDEPYRYSRQDGRNLLAAARLETEAARINPALVNNREISTVLTNPYTDDIKAQILAGMRGTTAGGGSTALQNAQRMGMLGKGIEATGGRYAQKIDANANKVDKAEVINTQLKGQTDARNQQSINAANRLNQLAANTSMQNRNAKLANENLVERAANVKLGQKAMNNLFNLNMKIGYSNDLPYYRAKLRDPMLNRNVFAENTETNTKTKKKKSAKYGGSVDSNTFIPRYTTMPYGN